MTVRLTKDGKWCEEGMGPILDFHEGDLYSGPDQARLVEVGWAEWVKDESSKPSAPASSVLKQTMHLAMFVPSCDDNFFQTADGEDLPPNMLSYGEPIDTRRFGGSLYFGFAAPGLPHTGARVFKILHSDDIDGGYEPVSAENLVYGKEDGRFPAIVHLVDPNAPDGRIPDMQTQGIPFAREGIVNTKQYVRIGMWANGARGGSVIVVAAQDAKSVPVPDNREWYKNGGSDEDFFKDIPSDILFAKKDEEKPEKPDVADDAPVDEPDTKEDADVTKDTIEETGDDLDDTGSTFREVLEKIVSAADSDKEAKVRIAAYAKRAFGRTVDRRKSLDDIMDDLLSSMVEGTPIPGPEDAN